LIGFVCSLTKRLWVGAALGAFILAAPVIVLSCFIGKLHTFAAQLLLTAIAIGGLAGGVGGCSCQLTMPAADGQANGGRWRFHRWLLVASLLSTLVPFSAVRWYWERADAMRIPEIERRLWQFHPVVDYSGGMPISVSVQWAVAFHDEDIQMLKDFRSLRVLDLSCTGIDGRSLSVLADLPNLTRLKVSHTKISDEYVNSLSCLTQLESLDLGSTRVSDTGLRALRPLKKLRRLGLQGDMVTNDGLTEIVSLTNLNELDLLGTYVSRDGLSRLKSLRSLRKIWFTDNGNPVRVSVKEPNKQSDLIPGTRTDIEIP
jgi:hypothetical protein